MEVLTSINLNIILLLDDKSRKKLKVNVTDLVNYKVNIIYSLYELTPEMVAQYDKVVLLGDYVLLDNAVANIKMFKAILNLNLIYIGTDDTWLNFMSRFAKVYKLDYSELDYNRLYSVVMEDVGALEEYALTDMKKVDSMYEFSQNIQLTKDIDESTRELASSFISIADMLKTQDKIITSLETQLEDANRKICNQDSLIEKLSESHLHIIKNSETLNKNLLQYEAIITKDVYDKLTVRGYQDRPTILYFKEYEELLHFNSLIETLYTAIRGQLHLSCKVVKLYDRSASKRLLALPPYYKIIRNNYTNSDILVDDFIVKYGSYIEMLELLLINKQHLDVLIIIDCKDHNEYVTLGHDLEFNLCRNEKHIENYKLSPLNTIVSNSSNTKLSWDTYEIYNDTELDNDTRLNYLTSRPVIQSLLEVLEKAIL